MISTGLKIGNVAETSALIYSPAVENTFYMRFEEMNAPGSSSSSAGPVELMCGGSKEMCNLRPSMTYCVQLVIKGQTGDSAAYKWHWTEEFTTRSEILLLIFWVVFLKMQNPHIRKK